MCIRDRAKIAQGPDLHGIDLGHFLRHWKAVLAEEAEDHSVVIADTLEELAEKLGFDPERFVSDIAQYHRSLSETPPVPPAPSPDGPGDGEMDLSFLMGPPPRPMEAGPYYAIKMKLFHENSVGGMVIDENTRVLRDGAPIPGLYAAGDNTRGIMLPGNIGVRYIERVFSALTVAFNTGYIAGVEAAAFAPVSYTHLDVYKRQAIGAHLAELVHDGDTIQLGIGGIPDAVGQCLLSKHDLGVHTEMITNSIVDLVAAGVVNGRKKSIHRGKIVGTFTLGNRMLYDFLDENPSVMLMPGSYVNHPSVIAQNDNMISINTTLNVDLTGQCASESIGSLQYSGSGGQSDTAIGALHAKNGRNVIAVKSVAHTKQGDISAINAQLPMGSVVTLSRNDIDYIVTEYGIADVYKRQACG